MRGGKRNGAGRPKKDDSMMTMSIVLSRATKERIQIIAKSRKQSVSSFVRECIESHILQYFDRELDISTSKGDNDIK